jgi:hypothetical protein
MIGLRCQDVNLEVDFEYYKLELNESTKEVVISYFRRSNFPPHDFMHVSTTSFNLNSIAKPLTL